MRILPEWIGYDEEIKALQLKIENESRQADKEGKFTKLILFVQKLIYIYYFLVHSHEQDFKELPKEKFQEPKEIKDLPKHDFEVNEKSKDLPKQSNELHEEL